LKEVAERDTRIRQLEVLNATLAAQIDRMRPVIQAAIVYARTLRLASNWRDGEAPLEHAVRVYQREMARLAGENER
jgi:alkyl hydroperoxide reductase subunit AhpC